MQKILEILNDIRPGCDIGPSTNLINESLIDSFDLINLVDELEQSYSIFIPPEKITPDNFKCAELIYSLIKECRPMASTNKGQG